MTKDVINQVMQIFRDAPDKEEAAASLLQMIKLFEPELFSKEKENGNK